MANSQDIFKREKHCVNHFDIKKKKKVSPYFITFRVKIWLFGFNQYDTEDHWDWKRGELILTILINNFKLDKVGYNEKLNVLRYKSLYWDPHPFTVEHYSPCPKFDSEVFFYNLSYQEYSTEYNL